MEAESEPRVWRAGGTARVSTGAAVAFAGGLLYAAARGVAAPGCARVGIACGALAAPFFALREVVAAGVGVDGPVASAIAGGFAGYFGALVVTGPRWQAVSKGAVVVGLGCGIADAVVQGIDWRRKLFLLNRADKVAGSGENSASQRDANATVVEGRGGEGRNGARTLRSMAIPSSTVLTELPGDGPQVLKPIGFPSGGSSWFKWPAWFPVLKDIDEEYQELIRRREATIVALEEERARIATLLEELELVKARSRNQPDAELGESNKPLLPRSAPRPPHDIF